ncbi:MAG: hypothetical protein Q8R72_12190 [Hylemonella sp.]|nr:hypothetical protein [Hylemonella sp.]
MTEAERLAWIDRLELEVFGQKRPELADYQDRYEKSHSLAAMWVWGGLPLAGFVGIAAQSFPLFLLLFCALYIGGAVLAFSLSARSPEWRWYFSGHATLMNLSAIPPLATWKALQSAATSSNDPSIRNLGARTWTNYQTALTALGRPIPDSAELKKGFADLFKWLPYGI